ncbi:hypothetical protein [Candidatus Manganitrophus noduliformans]|uniref:Holin n=1 Tax=Candidatus Manganitrophus noduliformans TaxID=2606439 RepID=A0A7X6DMM3_9BACT|nr:hypothetical protein [Candidatus Manganitrophus noduliformans]NKE69887.1 hypothetical protein [Candidatus Manganitrophus noduliformans]
MAEKLKSRKLWATVLTSVIVAMNSQLEFIPADSVDTVVNLIMIYIGGQAVVDAAAAVKKQG